MAHCTTNFKTKKAFKEAVKAGKEVGATEPIFPCVQNGTVFISGPWEYHKWHAQCQIQDGVITSVK